jgi:uncharacterized membrane protein YdjX (TVP38/TMEM64 family)
LIAPALRLAGLVAIVGTLFAVVALSGSLSAGRVRDWVDGTGVLAPLVFVPLSAALSVCLFPGPLLAAASGLLFGTWLGFPITLCSTVLGAVSAFALSRWVAGDAVAQLGGRRLRALREAVGRRGFASVLYARIAPGVPYNLVNYAAGLTPIRVATFAAATALGTAPRAFAYTALGGSIGNWRSPEAVVAAVVLVGMALVGAVLAWRGRRAAPPPA